MPAIPEGVLVLTDPRTGEVMIAFQEDVRVSESVVETYWLVVHPTRNSGAQAKILEDAIDRYRQTIEEEDLIERNTGLDKVPDRPGLEKIDHDGRTVKNAIVAAIQHIKRYARNIVEAGNHGPKC